MTHDTMMQITGLLIALLGGLGTLLTKLLLGKLDALQAHSKLHGLVLFYMATGTPIPPDVKTMLQTAMLNGRKIGEGI